MDKEALQIEKNYLLDTRGVIKDILDSKMKRVDDDEDEIYEINRYIWKDISSLTSDLDSIEQAFFDDITQQKHKIVLSDVKKITALKKAYHNAYFGRVDFNNEKIYIGITGVEKDDNFYVYDWRTPVASLFYNHNVGDASYETEDGKISGKLSLKRQYKVHNDEIIRCFDSNINIDDEYLQEILVASKSDKMTNIVNTIQKDQNKIIRNSKDKYLIVEGCAGSGKTSVALHHIAYLLYKNIKLTSNNVLILSPSDVFSKYISNVLPELGEDNVLSTTFIDFIYRFLNEFSKIESYPEYLERIYNSEYDINLKYKQDKNIVIYLDEFIENFKNNLTFEHGFGFKKQKFSAGQLTKYVQTKCSNLNVSEKINKLYDRLNGYLKIKTKKDEIAVKDMLKNIVNHNLDIVSIYNEFVDFVNNKYNYSFKYISSEYISYEDAIIALYLKLELFNYPADVMIKQVVIDEAQDYSLLQYVLMKKIFYKASYTIVGDTNQTINKYNKYESLKDIMNIFPESNYIVLNKTYRSSAEIIDYTNKILDINNVCSIQKNNNIPIKDISTSKPFDELLKDLELLSGKKIAIITKDSDTALKVKNKLKSKEISSTLYSKLYEKEENIIIVPSYISKGLEFENVILYNEKNNGYKEDERYLFYVVCTRSQSRLIIYNKEA